MAFFHIDTSSITAAFNALNVAAHALIPKLVPLGTTLAGVFAGVTLSYSVLMGMMSGNLEKTVAQLVQTMLIAVIVFTMLANWSGGPLSPVSFFLSMEDDITNALGGNEGITNAILGSIVKLENATGEFSKSATLSVFKSILAPWDLFAALGNMVGVYAITILLFLVIGLMVIALCIFLLYYNLGHILIYIGLIVGPIHLATIMLPVASELFSTWVRYMIGAVMYIVVGKIMSLLLAGIFTHGSSQITWLAKRASEGVLELHQVVPVMIVLGFWTILGIFIMKQIPTVAVALAGGANIRPSSTFNGRSAKSMIGRRPPDDPGGGGKASDVTTGAKGVTGKAGPAGGSSSGFAARPISGATGASSSVARGLGQGRSSAYRQANTLAKQGVGKVLAQRQAAAANFVGPIQPKTPKP